MARIIGVELGVKYKKKQKTHKLTDKQAAQRLKRGPTFRRWLSKRKLRYIATLDEMYLSISGAIEKRDGYYETKGKPAPSEYKKKEHSGWPPKILCAMGVCHRGSTSLRIVPENVKVNNEVFLKEVLIPIWKEDIPMLYPGEESKVILHMDWVDMSDPAPRSFARSIFPWHPGWLARAGRAGKAGWTRNIRLK